MVSSARTWVCLTTSVALIVLLGQRLRGFDIGRRVATGAGELVEKAELGDLVWDKIEPSTELKWHACYNDLQCARLKVPLNYSDPEDATASIAITRLPSPYLGTKSYRGPVLFNPGGPGGSGVALVTMAGYALANLIGAEFDVLSFDPRGVGLSTPRASFFDTDAARALWGNNFHVLNSTADGLARAWARAQIMGRLAERHDNGELIHINTENTARDMLQIVEAHGDEQIKYWGFSYVAAPCCLSDACGLNFPLVATFASLFPDRIERLILDGVVDSTNYFATLWSNNLLDTDKTLQSFFDSCAAAGPTHCPFYEPTPELIQEKLEALTRSIYLRPVPVQTESFYGLVDYARLRLTVFQSLYSPYASFYALAQGLFDLSHGDGTLLYRILEQPAFECSCGQPHLPSPVADGQAAILCTDGDVVRDTIDDLQEYVDALVATSQWGEIWASIRIGCTAWPSQTKKHFRGPFVGNTSHPILWVGNTADPVTPVSAAHKMAKGFPGSIVLTQDSPGHCSIAAPSTCTQTRIRNYLLHGKLPKEGEVCSVDFPIFSPLPPPRSNERMGPVPDDDNTQSPLPATVRTAEDEAILEALEQLRASFRIPMPFLL